jgi:hypothetical protein
VKGKILGTLSVSAIPAMLPREYASRVRDMRHLRGEYTVVLFSHSRDGRVTTSADVRRTMRHVESSPLMAIGVDFTLEATQLLIEHGAEVVRLGEFGWTDRSYAAVRT